MLGCESTGWHLTLFSESIIFGGEALVALQKSKYQKERRGSLPDFGQGEPDQCSLCTPAPRTSTTRSNTSTAGVLRSSSGVCVFPFEVKTN